MLLSRQLLRCRARVPHAQWRQVLFNLQTRSRSNRASEDHGRPPVIAIVGSGPAGFYTAQKLMREIHGTRIDMYEQLPVPFGLVRFGVAPDHPEVKNVQETFQDVATSPNYTFIGNVNLGHELPLDLLSQSYDAIVFAYGASKDRKLGLEGEDKSNVYSARAFVGWYNGLPEYRDLNPNLTAGENAIVVGQGNVALDVARTLLTDVDALRKTDITEHALEALSRSRLKHVRVVGRRGPLQAAFTIKEVRELLHLPDVSFEPIPSELFTDLSKLPRPKKRLLELLKKGSPAKPAAGKSWALDFLLSPTSLVRKGDGSESLEAVTFVRNVLSDPSSTESKISSTSDEVTMRASTLFRSIGYKAEPIPGMATIGADFDEYKGRLNHDGYGRLESPGAANESGTTEKTGKTKLYCAGWVKRGPTGVIASTMTDAFETAEAIVEDWRTKSTAGDIPRGWHGVSDAAAARQIKLKPVHWDKWRAIDNIERRQGEDRGKPREKLATVKEMLEASEVRLRD